MSAPWDDDALMALADEAPENARRRRKVEDFRYDEQQAKYWDITSGELLEGKSVDGAVSRQDWTTQVNDKGKVVKVRPSVAINDIDTGLTVETSTWWPGLDTFIWHKLINARGMMPLKGACVYNTYKAPDRSLLRKDGKPDLWINHVKKLYPEKTEQEHFFDYCAHMLQFPQIKVNHGIVIAGAQGIGKDTLLYPIRQGVGEHNVCEIEPDETNSPYTHYTKSVMLMINEVRPLDEDSKASNFYNKIKPLLAAPPEVLAYRLLYQNTTYVRNVCRVFLTTNDMLTMYIPSEDRRLFVMGSRLPDPKENKVFPENYFKKLWDDLLAGGSDAVVNWLLERDVSHFEAGTPPPMTAAKLEIINSAKAVRTSPMNELMESYYEQFHFWPKVIFSKDLHDLVNHSNLFDDAEQMKKAVNAKNAHFKMDEYGYTAVRPKDFGMGASKFKNGSYECRVAYVRKEIPLEERGAVLREELSHRPLAFGFK